MKVAITIKEKALPSEMDPRLGRCTAILYWDTETGDRRIEENRSADAASGAGIETATRLSEAGVQAVITGHAGPKAAAVLEAAGITVYEADGGTAAELMDAFTSGRLKPAGSLQPEPSARAASAPPAAQTADRVIAVSSETTQGLDSPVSHHFGRCPVYTFVTIRNGKPDGVRSVENPFFHAHEPGRVPAFIRDQGAGVMLAGGMGQRAVGFFQQFGIAVATGASGTVRDTIASYLDGRLSGVSPCTDHHGHDCH